MQWRRSIKPISISYNHVEIDLPTTNQLTVQRSLLKPDLHGDVLHVRMLENYLSDK